jgi:hypothetical protein
MRLILFASMVLIVCMSCSISSKVSEPGSATDTSVAEYEQITLGTPEPEIEMVEVPEPTEEVAATPTDVILIDKEPEDSPVPELQPTGDLTLYMTLPQLNYVIGDTLYALVGTNLQAYDITTKDMLWMANIHQPALKHADETNLYVLGAPQRLDVYSSQNGEFRWKLLLPEPFKDIINYKDGEFIFVITATAESEPQNTMLIVQKNDGQVVQSISNLISGEPYNRYFSSLENLMLFVAGYERGTEFVGWSPLTHQELYRVSISDKDYLVCNETIIIEKLQSGFDVYDLRSGEALWSNSEARNIKENLFCNPAADWNSAYYIFSLEHPFLYKRNINLESRANFLFARLGNDVVSFDPRSGNVLWKSTDFEEPGKFFAQASDWLGEVGNILIYSSANYGITQAYDAITHQFLWENPGLSIQSIVGRYQDTVIAFVLKDRYGTDIVNNMVGFDKNSGKILWDLEMGDQPIAGVFVTGKWIVWNSAFDFTKPDVHFVNVETGEEASLFRTKGDPMFYYEKDEYFFITSSNEIYIFK